MDKSMNCITMIAKIHFISSCFHIERVIIEFFFSLFSFVFFRFCFPFCFAYVTACCFPSLQHDVFSILLAALIVLCWKPAIDDGLGIRCCLDTHERHSRRCRRSSTEFWFCRLRARKQFDEIVMSSLISKRNTNQSNNFFFFPLLRLSSLGWTWIERRNCRSISIACQCHSTYSPRARPSNTLARLAFDDRNKGKLNHVTMEKRARERSEKC
jgi:hypothetical protein